MFNCCEREDETKYLHLCGCPSASFTCESESITPALCGISELTGGGVVASVPPKKYRSYLVSFTGTTMSLYIWNGRICNGAKIRTSAWSGSGIRLYGKLDCAFSESSTGLDTQEEYSRRIEDGECVNEVSSTVESELGWVPGPGDPTSTTEKTSEQDIADPTVPGESGSHVATTILSDEDTDQDAIDRETPVGGTYCSSLWSVRSTGFSWTKRTSEYTIECANLVKGLQYKVTPKIETWTATIGSESSPVDHPVTSKTFTASGDTHTLPTKSLPFSQGHGYQITSVIIEKA